VNPSWFLLPFPFAESFSSLLLFFSGLKSLVLRNMNAYALYSRNNVFLPRSLTSLDLRGTTMISKHSIRTSIFDNINVLLPELTVLLVDKNIPRKFVFEAPVSGPFVTTMFPKLVLQDVYDRAQQN